MIEIIGKKFGRLTPLRRLGVFHRCLCDCGKEVTIRNDRITSGKTSSCGCFRADLRKADRELTEKLKREAAAQQLAFENARRSVFKTEKRLKAVWRAMIARCENPANADYCRYGARGITVCAEWHDFHVFHADMRPKYVDGWWLEREHNDEGYRESNCIFASPKRQGRNRRNTIKLRSWDGSMVPMWYLVRQYKVKQSAAYAWYYGLVAKEIYPTVVGFYTRFNIQKE